MQLLTTAKIAMGMHLIRCCKEAEARSETLVRPWLYRLTEMEME